MFCERTPKSSENGEMPSVSFVQIPYKMKIHSVVQMVLEVSCYTCARLQLNIPLEAGSPVATLLMQLVPSVTDASVVIKWHIQNNKGLNLV